MERPEKAMGEKMLALKGHETPLTQLQCTSLAFLKMQFNWEGHRRKSLHKSYFTSNSSVKETTKI